MQKIQLEFIWVGHLECLWHQFYFHRKDYETSYKEIMGTETLQDSTDAIKVEKMERSTTFLVCSEI